MRAGCVLPCSWVFCRSPVLPCSVLLCGLPCSCVVCRAPVWSAVRSASASWARLGALLGPWAVVGASWTVLGTSGLSRSPPGGLLGRRGQSSDQKTNMLNMYAHLKKPHVLCFPRPSWRSSWSALGAYRRPLGPFEPPREPSDTPGGRLGSDSRPSWAVLTVFCSTRGTISGSLGAGPAYIYDSHRCLKKAVTKGQLTLLRSLPHENSVET